MITIKKKYANFKIEHLIIDLWFESLSNLDKIRITDEESFKEYVNTYLTILDIRDLTKEYKTGLTSSIHKLASDKVIRMHGKVNSLTLTKYKSLRKTIYGDE